MTVIKRDNLFGSIFLSLLLVATFPVLAQSDQVIELDCLGPGHSGDQMNIIKLDLAAKSVSVEYSLPNPGGFPDPLSYKMQGPVTAISDREIRWTYTSVQAVPGFTPSFGNGTFMLDRYTGIMTEERGSDPGSTFYDGPVQCHKQEKQF
jgi:hypothetical protein